MAVRSRLSALAFGGALIACGAGGAAPAAPTSAASVQDGTSTTDATPLTDLPLARSSGTCVDRARAHPLCVRAAEGECRARQGDCEAACEPRLGPGSSEKQPELRGALEADRCREGCRQSEGACARAMRERCPAPCGADAGT